MPFDPLRPTGLDNPRPVGAGDPIRRYVQPTFDPDDPTRLPPTPTAAAPALVDRFSRLRLRRDRRGAPKPRQ